MVAARRSGLAAIVGAAALAAGCGGGSDSGKPEGTGAGGTSTEGKRGGEVTVLAAGDVDYVDPGQTYYVFALMIHNAVNRGLYTYKPGDREQPTPDLATGPPEIGADRRSVTVRLRRGVRFAPPVDREVTAKDVKYGFERAFSANVPSSYASVYFGDLVGAPAEPGAIRDIPGIETPDDRTIVFRLRRPRAVLVSQALAMPIATPVPEEYARPFDAKSPSTYDQHVAFTGPYMIANDAKGKLTGRQPGKRIELVRNPNWDADTDFRPAYLDRVVVEEGNDDATVSSRRILNGSGLLQGDGAPPAPVLKQAVERFKEQIVLVPGGGYRHVSLNTTVEPFDDLNVRKAVLAAFDREAMRLTRGGELLGDIPTHFLPPGFPGHEEAGGARGPGLDFLRNPKGDMALAASYMRKAGYPSGRYTGSERLLMVATNADPGKKSAEVAANQFEKLGFKLNFRIVPQDTLYTRFCNRPSADVAICPNVGFFKDFFDPQSMLEPVFSGDAIREANNTNWAELDDPKVDAAMKRAAALQQGPERNRAWGEVDRLVTAQAPGVPWIWDKQPLIASKDVRAVANEYATGWDLSFSSLK